MTDSSILAEMKPCGVILASRLYKFFALQCVYCRNKYGHWATFMGHLKETHRVEAEESRFLKDVIYNDEQWEIVPDVVEVTAEVNHACTSVAPASPTLSCDVSELVEALDDQLITEETLYEELEEQGNYDANAAEVANDAATLPVQYEVIEGNVDDAMVDYGQMVDDVESNYDEAVITTREFQLNFTGENDAATLLFITLYKRYPCLWQLYQSRTIHLQQRAKAKKELLKLLGEHNFEVSMKDVEQSILQLHQYFDDIARRLEEGLEISDVAEKYYQACDFLKPFSSVSVTRKTPIDALECNNSTALQSDDIDADEDSNAMDGSQYSSICPDYTDSGDEDNTAGNSNKLLVSFSSRNKATCDFIQCFRSHPCLWNPKDAAYGDTDERIQALIEIREFFAINYQTTFTEYSLRTAIKRLLTFYKRCSQIKRNLSTVRYFYYERCAFLAGIDLNDKVEVKSNSTKKITFESLNQYTLDFIDLCAKYPVLWDSKHPDYSVQNARLIAYQEMAAQIQQIYAIELHKDELYDCIYKIKHSYYSLQEKKHRNKPLTRSDLIYLERGKFLPSCKLRVQCNICDRVLRSELTLQIHLLKEHNIGELPFKCNYCEQRFAHRTTMKEHEVRTHTKQFDWLCQYCNKGFASRRDKQQHELVHTGARNCICEHCGKCFRLKHQMTEHVKIVHERLRRFKCTMCPKVFLRKTQLKDHIHGHLNIRDKVCGECGKTFTNFNALFRHKQIHSEVKRYVCKICGERFHQYVGMSSHMKRRHALVNVDKNSDSKPMAEAVEEGVAHVEHEEHEVDEELNFLNP